MQRPTFQELWAAFVDGNRKFKLKAITFNKKFVLDKQFYLVRKLILNGILNYIFTSETKLHISFESFNVYITQIFICKNKYWP